MPKQDRAASMKKENTNVRKRIVAESKQAQKEADHVAAEESAVLAAEEEAKKKRAPPPSKFDVAMRAGKASSSFAQAAASMDDDDDDGGDADAGREPAAPARGAAREAPSSGKKAKEKKKGGSFQDEIQLLEEEQKAAKRQRIISRFLRLTIVGMFMDLEGDKSEKPAPKDEKPNKKKKNGKAASEEQEAMSFGDMQRKYSGPVLMLLFILVVVGGKMFGEDFSVDFDDSVNYYAVMGVERDVDVISLRKVYKKLALELHPDKNPDCTDCKERFEKISTAYETLSDPERRKAYDQRKTLDGELKSAASMDLTDEDFEAQVFRSNEVWYVQVYDPSAGSCRSFHPVWEDIASNYGEIARFGRLDMTKNRRALALLPQRVLRTPVVFRYARGMEPEMFQWTLTAEERSITSAGKPFKKFILEQYPGMERYEDTATIKRWWGEATADRPKIVISGAGKATPIQQKQVQRMAHVWAGFFDIAFANPEATKTSLGGAFDPGYGWMVAMQGGKMDEKRRVKDLEGVVGALNELVPKGMGSRAPHITVRNHQQLCAAPAQGARHLCLFLVDADDSRAAAAIEELSDSRRTFAEESADAKAGDDEATEENFHIQVVRLQTSGSRLPWMPTSVGSSFGTLWKEAERSRVFAVELEGRRIAAIKSKTFHELYQSIAYDDVKFGEVPEEVSTTLHLMMPDPEVSLRSEFNRILSTIPGMLLAFLLFAVVLSVFPELSVVETGAFMGVLSGLLLVVWPWAFRKSAQFLWCFASSSFVCQCE